jgi:hypothetical protein
MDNTSDYINSNNGNITNLLCNVINTTTSSCSYMSCENIDVINMNCKNNFQFLFLQPTGSKIKD